MSGIDRIDVLAIPYCPANKKWLGQSQHLIERFEPGVTLVHHFDNFLNPYTLSKYMDLGGYRRILHERCPDARFYFSKIPPRGRSRRNRRGMSRSEDPAGPWSRWVGLLVTRTG